MPYLYGTYGTIVESTVTQSSDTGTIPAYIGTAPIHLIKGWNSKGLVNRPIRVHSLSDAEKTVGYCADFEHYTLCEPIAAHFDMGVTGIGPIYMINVLDPAKHKVEEPVTETLAFTNNHAFIPGMDTIIDSVKITRPFDQYKAMGFVKSKKDCETVFNSYGKNATGKIKNDQIFYWVFDKTVDKSIDLLIEIEAKGKKYGCLDLGKNRGSGVTIAYMSLNAGDHDFVDGVAGKETLDLTGYTGDITMTLYHCKGTDLQTYPTNLVKVESVAMHFDNGDSPQYFDVGEDYEISYNGTRGGLTIQDVNGTMPATSTVTYEQVDPTKVTAAEIIGSTTLNGEVSGISALKLLFLETGAVANVLAAPGWSGDPDVCAALSQACRKINGHWDAFYVVDIPLEDDGEQIDTMHKAIQWKAERKLKGAVIPGAPLYNDERSKVCWPEAVDARGRIFHSSTLCVVSMLRTDQENGDIPMETPGNKSVPIVRQYFGAKSKNAGFDQSDAEAVVQHGITTVTPWASDWVLWGDHTAAYEFEDEDVDPRAVFDNRIRMLMHITNSFQREWAPTIDEPMTRSLIDTISNREQEKLDQLVSMGALIGNPTVSFVNDPADGVDLANGHFVWAIATTPTPPLKSATVQVSYTDEGFVTYWGEE